MDLLHATTAFVAYEGRPTAADEAILNQVVSLGTQGNYAHQELKGTMRIIIWN